MIKTSSQMTQSIITDEELEHLGEMYLQLKQNKTFQRCSKDFQQFVIDYLAEELNGFNNRKDKS